MGYHVQIPRKVPQKLAHAINRPPVYISGDGVVWLPQEGVVFAGDLVFFERLLGRSKPWFTALTMWSSRAYLQTERM